MISPPINDACSVSLSPLQSEQLTYTIPQAASIANISRSSLYKYLSNGELKARKIGRRSIILKEDLVRWLNSLPEIQE